ncbi:MAG: hypothetical protein LJE60_00910 [Thiocapsa sp.]|jgi:hypothetical protein|nr:hypothetical protein [Thiocapsa sp.]MCG6895657.1 hypothetical protein [Thiocapsa sp.]
MMIQERFRGLLTALLLVTLPASNAWATHRSEAEKAIQDAKEAHALAESAGVASPETAEMIQKAEGLMPSRQFTKAQETAMNAMKQDLFAFEQSKGGQVDQTKDAAAQEAIGAAEAARKKAASVNGEWRDTAQFIKEAEDLAKSGDFDAAIALADKARRQGEMGYEQALRERGATFPSYVTKQK